MDTGKLLRIIEDIKKDEQVYGFQSRFQNILNYYNDNNRDALNDERQRLYEDIDKSLLSNYVMTDVKALESINAYKYFGIESKKVLEEILSTQVHELAQKLQEFLNLRQDFLNKFNSVGESLNSLGIKSRVLVSGQFEIGFSFPEQYMELDNLEKLIDDLDKFLMSLAEDDPESKKYKINYVSNGSLEFFISATQHLAYNFDIALDYVLKIYAAIEMCKKIKAGYKHYKKSKRDEIDAYHDQELLDEKNNLIESFVNEVNITEPDRRIKIRTFFIRIVGYFESGVSAEVRTPSIEAPREPTEEDDAEVKKGLKQERIIYDAKREIDEKNKKIFELQRNNFYGVEFNLPKQQNSDDPENE